MNVTCAYKISLEIHKAMFESVVKVMSPNQLHQLMDLDKYMCFNKEAPGQEWIYCEVNEV